jgi:hypothetical protein
MVHLRPSHGSAHRQSASGVPHCRAWAERYGPPVLTMCRCGKACRLKPASTFISGVRKVRGVESVSEMRVRLDAVPDAVGQRAAPDRRRWLILATVAVAQLMIALDLTVVNIALPSAQRSLHFPSVDRQQVVTGPASTVTTKPSASACRPCSTTSASPPSLQLYRQHFADRRTASA